MNNKPSINDMRVLATNRGGECLSDEYVSNRHKLEWKCSLGHIWWAQPRAVKRGTWCPTCSSGLGERICRLVFEKVFGKPFPKIRPPWLLSKASKRCLELDGYCEEMNIAFEYNGRQHYEDSPIFKTPTNDRKKHAMCKKHGVKVFIVPETSRTPTVEYVKGLIIDQCKSLGVDMPDNISDIAIDIDEAYRSSKDAELLDRIKKIAISKGGVCLSDVYLGCCSSFTFQCGKCGHIWQAKPRDIVSGSWCLRCAGRAYSIEDAIKIAEANNGRCLSTEFINGYLPLEWECQSGHKWSAPFRQMRRGTWCLQCHVEHLRGVVSVKIDTYKEIALSKGGLCLSDTITGCRDKLELQCAKGHIWLMSADRLRSTTRWCPICTKEKRREEARKQMLGNSFARKQIE